ncbi:uncharacterized protein LOC111127125 isoform X2 [Crassostrea virginica]
MIQDAQIKSRTPKKMSFFSMKVITISMCLMAVVINAQNNISRIVSSLRPDNGTTQSKTSTNLAGSVTAKNLIQRETNKIPPTTTRVVFPDRLILKGENGKSGWQSKDRVAAILCWYCITTWSPQYCITLCHRHWLR